MMDQLCRAAEVFANAWYKHLFTPGNGTALDYVNARTELCQLMRPDIPLIDKQNASKLFQQQSTLAEMGWSTEELTLP